METKKTLVTWFAILVLMGVSLTSCAPAAAPKPVLGTPTPAPAKPTATVEAPKYGGILRWPRTSDIKSFDSHIEGTVGPTTMCTYENLVKYNADGVLVPVLATSWEISGGGLTYTFYLRKGACPTNQFSKSGPRATPDSDRWFMGQAP